MASDLKPNLEAYYYSFVATGVPEIDAILSAVATAGRRYHHTADWYEDNHGEGSCIDIIQSAANNAAVAWNTRKEPTDGR